jgi:hypothetical protein
MGLYFSELLPSLAVKGSALLFEPSINPALSC